jgi:hypothetical protein
VNATLLERIEAFEKRAKSAEAKLSEAVRALEQAAAKFDEYALSHYRKRTEEGDAKALTNANMAAMCRSTLATIQGGGLGVSQSQPCGDGAQPILPPEDFAELEAHVRALPPFEDAELAPSIVLRLIELARVKP